MKNNVMSTVILYKLYDFIHENAEAVPDIIHVFSYFLSSLKVCNINRPCEPTKLWAMQFVIDLTENGSLVQEIPERPLTGIITRSRKSKVHKLY